MCIQRLPWHLFLAVTAIVTCAASLPAAERLSLPATELLRRSVTRHVRLSPDGTALELSRGELIEDDGPAAGYSYRPNEETLSETTWIRKELLLADARTDGAVLLVGSGGQLAVRVNGRSLVLPPPEKAGNYWQRYAIPPDVLQPGANAFVLSGKGKIWIAREDDFASGSPTRTHHPNRSSRSTDAGQTWTDHHLGTGNDLDGEYYVRLFLDRHHDAGTLELPVMDLGNLAEAALAPPLAECGPLSIEAKAEPGPAGKVMLRVRSGTSFVPDAAHWSAWQTLAGLSGTVDAPRGRFVQVAIDLSTNDPRTTPALQELVVSTASRPASEWQRQAQVKTLRNGAVVRTSIPFAYEPFEHPVLKQFRQQQRLDDIAAGAGSEWELICRLAAWSAKQWDKGHLQASYPGWNALEILQAHADGTPVGGFCQQYNLVFLQACESFGLVGRAVSIGAGDHGVNIRSGHEVVEIWSNEHCKWVYIDGQAAWYFVDEATQVPLSLRELRERQLQVLRGEPSVAVQIVEVGDQRFAWTGLTGWPAFVELRMIPRSNFLEQASPLPLNQGMRGWFWTGHEVWTDSAAPASLLFGQRVEAPNNWDWTLNQTRFALEATETPGELLVHLDTETPGFQKFMATIDNEPPRPVKSGFEWRLRSGSNVLSVRSINSAGREGSPGSIAIELKPGFSKRASN